MRKTLPALGFCLTSLPLLRAAYEVSLVIAKAKAPHTAGRKRIKPSAVKMAQILLGRNEVKRIDSVPFFTAKCDSYRREKCSHVLQNLSLKLPCSFVSMGQWNLLHYLMTIDSN